MTLMTKALLTMVFTAHWHLPKPEKPTRPARPKQTPSLRPNASAEVTERNAARVNETLRLAKTDHKDALAEHAEPQGKASEPTMTLASRIDRVLVGGGSDDILLKTYPTFAMNKVTVARPQGQGQHPRWREFLLLFRTRIRAADQRRPRFGYHRRRQASRADGRDERFDHAGVWHGDEQERQHC